MQNQLNPVNENTVFTFNLPENSKVHLSIYDMMARKVAILLNGKNKVAGKHSIYFNASHIPKGTYFYRLQIGDTVITEKMTLQ